MFIVKSGGVYFGKGGASIEKGFLDSTVADVRCTLVLIPFVSDFRESNRLTR